ncbi:MAG TPA: 8-oxo-dGTP diphosphatase [Candidatus Faecousia intestinigallinarum]|nr:8-oxo-dGTP diphosphatase [Candidatus Faecousia intestinigallinarum]
MDRTQTVTLTNMCMVYQDNRVLVLDKIDGQWNGITFPGGHVEKEESFADAVVREVYEETGLTISSPQLCGIKDWTEQDGSRYIVLLYKTNKFEGMLKASDEGEVYWMELEELSKMQLSIDFLDMLKVFLDDNLSEFYYYFQDGKWQKTLK